MQLPLQILVIAISASMLAGITCSLIGVFVVHMKLSSIGFSMSHAAFAGAALGLLITIDPLITALLFAAVVALILGPISEKAQLPAEVVTGILFSTTIGLGFIFLSLIPSTAISAQALSILWGSVFSVTIDDLILLGLLSFFMIVILILFSKELQALMFNRKLAEASGINTSMFYFLILFLTGVTVAFSLKLVGGLLVFALIVTPASSSLQFVYDMKKAFIIAPIMGSINCVIGFIISLLVNLPIGSSIVIAASIIFGASVIISPKRKRGNE